MPGNKCNISTRECSNKYFYYERCLHPIFATFLTFHSIHIQRVISKKFFLLFFNDFLCLRLKSKSQLINETTFTSEKNHNISWNLLQQQSKIFLCCNNTYFSHIFSVCSCCYCVHLHREVNFFSIYAENIQNRSMQYD